VQRATIHEAFASATFKQSTIKHYTKQDEVFLDLNAGRIDGTLMDSVAADEGFLKTPAGKGFGFVGPAFTDPKYFGNGAGVVLRKTDAELAKKFNEAIAAHRASGATKALADKYFAYDILPK
jgi:arginine/ornithine transport system substrate-binding protein